MIYISTSFFSISEKECPFPKALVSLKPFLPICFQCFPINVPLSFLKIFSLSLSRDVLLSQVFPFPKLQHQEKEILSQFSLTSSLSLSFKLLKKSFSLVLSSYSASFIPQHTVLCFIKCSLLLKHLSIFQEFFMPNDCRFLSWSSE